jgi:para-aminobenzoate synthetase
MGCIWTSSKTAKDAEAQRAQRKAGGWVRVLVLDNRDSYTGILASLIGWLVGERPRVVLNDAVGVEEIREWGPDAIVISPGPGRPDVAGDFGVCEKVFDAFPGVPVLGVCLGHQGLGVWAGARVVREAPVHGYTSEIFHSGMGLFEGLPCPFKATRYHSLVVERESVPDCLEVTAWTASGLVMGLRHRTLPFYGVQFHPESSATMLGTGILANFLGVPFLKARPAVPRVDQALLEKNRQSWPERLPWVDPALVFGGHFAKLETAFWLDSDPKGGPYSRWSVMGTGKQLEKGELRAALGWREQEPGLEVGSLPYGPGLYGFRGYGGGKGLPGRAAALLPAEAWILAEEVVLFDHHERCVYARDKRIVEELEVLPEAEEPVLRPNRSKRDYLLEIERIFEELYAGNSYEVCLTLGAEFEVQNALGYYRYLREKSPGAYGAFLKFKEGFVVSVSPELLVKVDGLGLVESAPIKGTRPRGKTSKEDEQLLWELLNSEKDQAELQMITDLIRNDLALACVPGSIVVLEDRQVTEHTLVWHTSSLIRGTLEVDVLGLMEKVFPGGSVTGAPKYRTMEILNELERRARGVYTGSIGYVGRDGRMVMSVAIRTAEIDQEGRGWTGAGGAVVVGSKGEEEWEEVMVKLGVMGRKAKRGGAESAEGAEDTPVLQRSRVNSDRPNGSILDQGVFISRHTLERLREHYPRIGVRGALDLLGQANEEEGAFIAAFLGRSIKEVQDRYFVTADCQGVFVIARGRKEGDLPWQTVTYLRFGAYQQEIARKLKR